MTNSNISGGLQWLGFVISLLAGLLTGLATAFNAYAIEMKETFGYTQSQVELVSSVGLIGSGLSFLHAIILDKFGFKRTYVLIIITSPVPCILIYVATMFKTFFSNWAVLVGLFLLVANLNTNSMMIQVIQIGVSNFSKNHVGKVIALYIGVVGLGKCFFCGLFELLFVGDLGGFFLALGLLWTLFGVLCFFLHRPSDVEEEEIPILHTTEDQCIRQADCTEGGVNSNDATNKCEIRKIDILKSRYFHMMFWSSVIFYGCFFTFMDNLTAVGESSGIENPLVLIYLMSVIMVTSRLFVGILYDHFSSDTCGFLCLYTSYFCFVIAMIIGLTWFNKTSVFLMTILLGISVAGGNTLPWTLLASHFGRKHYSAMTGGFFAFLVQAVIILQMFVGFFYDREITNGSPDSRQCYGSHCFMWTFVMLLCTTVVVFLLQLLNHIFIDH